MARVSNPLVARKRRLSDFYDNTRKPASMTRAGQKRERDYYIALGKFVDIFARVERAVALGLWHYAMTPHEIARAVFSGVRVKEGMSLIKRLAEVRGADATTVNDLDYIAAQLGAINDARNNLLHYGAVSIAEGDGRVSDALKAIHPKEFPISPAILDAMTADCRKVIFHLHSAHMGRTPLAGVYALAILRTPWQYKHQPQRPLSNKAAAKPRSSRKRAPEQAGQP